MYERSRNLDTHPGPEGVLLEVGLAITKHALPDDMNFEVGSVLLPENNEFRHYPHLDTRASMCEPGCYELRLRENWKCWLERPDIVMPYRNHLAKPKITRGSVTLDPVLCEAMAG